MKSAYELAMEKFGGDDEEIIHLTTAQKEQIAEIDRKYNAEIVHAKMTAGEKMKTLSNPEEQRQLQQDLNVEIKSHEEKKERGKEKIRHQAKDEQ